MKRLIFILLFGFYYVASSAQQTQIQLKTDYGSENKDIQELMRFQGVEKIALNFEGEDLKGKDYAFIIKEFTNGRLAKADTLVASSKSDYMSKIEKNRFKVDVMVATRLDHSVKFYVKFDRFSINKLYDVEKPKDAYALHDFLGEKQSLEIKSNTPTYILGYFLPYVDKDTGWKMYCEVSGSKNHPDDWGKAFDIPNYFLVEVQFY